MQQAVMHPSNHNKLDARNPARNLSRRLTVKLSRSRYVTRPFRVPECLASIFEQSGVKILLANSCPRRQIDQKDGNISDRISHLSRRDVCQGFNGLTDYLSFWKYWHHFNIYESFHNLKLQLKTYER